MFSRLIRSLIVLIALVAAYQAYVLLAVPLMEPPLAVRKQRQVTEDDRRRAVDTAFFVGTHRETNYDPDDGLGRDIVVIVNGQPVVEDLSERFSYRAAGVRGEFMHTLGRVTWRLNLKFERDEYERTEAVANLDHDFFYTGVDLDYDLSDVMTLSFGLRRLVPLLLEFSQTYPQISLAMDFSDRQLNLIEEGIDLSIRELAEMVRDIVYRDATLTFDPSKPDGMPRKLLDVSRLHRLGWHHSIDLREGIASTYQWFLDHRDSLRRPSIQPAAAVRTHA